MKKIFLLLVTLMMMFNQPHINANNADSAQYTVWYQQFENSNWIEGITYSDYGQCEQGIRFTYSWAYKAKCLRD